MPDNPILIRIRELCNQRGWSLYKLSKESGIAYSGLNNIFLRNTVDFTANSCYIFQRYLAGIFGGYATPRKRQFSSLSLNRYDNLRYLLTLLSRFLLKPLLKLNMKGLSDGKN